MSSVEHDFFFIELCQHKQLWGGNLEVSTQQQVNWNASEMHKKMELPSVV